MGQLVTLGTRTDSSVGPVNLFALIPLVQEELQRRSFPVPSWGAPAAERTTFTAAIIRALGDRGLVQAPGERRQVGQTLADWMLGLGVLQSLIDQDGVEDIFVTGGYVSVIRRGVHEYLGPLAPDEYFKTLAVRVADLRRARLRAADPMVLVTLPGGHRFTAAIPPVSTTGTVISIRVFPQTPLALTELVPDEQLRSYLVGLAAKLPTSLLISGEPGAGKTTLLSALTAELPPWCQVRIVEKFAELRYQGPLPAFHLVTQEEYQDAPVTMGQLVDVFSTRTRPHLMIVGEIVADEAGDFLHAANLGVRAWGTIHSNSAYDALLRLEDLTVATGRLPLEAIQTRIARNIGVVIHLGMSDQGQRFVREIVRVQGLREGRYELVTRYQRGAAQAWTSPPAS
ncbi:MAG: Flp pilus assembly complex ATPase component TadA [Chloroflexi bacterium]|nr:Flp pilus assembly complex ATPase component TadA [Chloroflexota bacterium]